MKEIRIHGRGGQGVVMGAEMLAYAFVLEGQYASAFPTFGAERRGRRWRLFCDSMKNPSGKHTRSTNRTALRYSTHS